jgi:signal transduction histidine kinase
MLIEHRALLEERRADVAVAPSLPAVRGCVPILNQVLSNLLTNALKYTREGENPVVRISAETRNRTIVLRVADRGIGIDRRHHERIFRIFERLHGYSKYPGSGVGLAIARRAVERMHGRIWVESQPDQGSCFCIELPKA